MQKPPDVLGGFDIITILTHMRGQANYRVL